MFSAPGSSRVAQLYAANLIQPPFLYSAAPSITDVLLTAGGEKAMAAASGHASG